VRLRALRLTNFRQHANTSIDFGSGLTGIVGQNGSGKTTIFEAIAWALYGNDAARGRRDSIRFTRAEPKAQVRVELEFELAGHRYRVVRGLNGAELYLDDGPLPIANSISSVTDVVHRRLGMSRTEFFNTYFTGQKELSVMTTLGPTERGQFLSRVLGYERLRAAQDLARDRRRELIAELSGLRQAMPDPDAVERNLSDAAARLTAEAARAADARAQRLDAEAALQRVTPLWEAAQRDRARQQQAAADLRVADADVVARKREHERATAAMLEAEAAADELTRIAPDLAPLRSLRAEHDALGILAREEGRRKALTDTLRVAGEDLDRLLAHRAGLEAAIAAGSGIEAALDQARRALTEATAAYETARTEWVRDRQEAETRRDALRVQYADIKAQRDRIIDAGEDGTCPTCSRPLGTHFREMLETLDAQLRSVTADGSFYKSRVEQLASPPDALAGLDARRRSVAEEVSALERSAAELKGLTREHAASNRDLARQQERVANVQAQVAGLPSGYDRQRHADVEREIERLAPLDQRAGRLAVAADRLPLARAELAGAATAVDNAVARAARAREQVASSGIDEAAFERLRAEYGRSLRASTDAAIAAAAGEEAAAAAKRQHDTARAAHEDLQRTQARLRELVTERRLHDELDQAYTDLRTDLNFALRPEISALASGFIRELTDDRYSELDLDDQYNLVIIEDGVPKPVISGGEEDLANLVMRLAVSQMIADRAGHAFSLLILDEVFGSLDEERRHNVVRLMRRLHDRFEQVILITHIESQHDFDQVLRVRYDAVTGASVVQPYAGAEPGVDVLATLERAS
jgi:exonuclease SbcC